jgi:hypothetical protein
LNGRFVVSLFAWILILSCPLSASGPPPSLALAYSASTSQIVSEIARRGPRTVVEELYEHRSDWDYVLSKVKGGEEAWLRVAVALHPGTDAGSSSMLREAVGLALLTAPEFVLRLAIPAFSLSDVCGGRPDPLPTYSAAVAELERQIVSVAAVDSGAVAKTRDRCLDELKASRANLKRFFNVK